MAVKFPTTCEKYTFWDRLSPFDSGQSPWEKIIPNRSQCVPPGPLPSRLCINVRVHYLPQHKGLSVAIATMFTPGCFLMSDHLSEPVPPWVGTLCSDHTLWKCEPSHQHRMMQIS